MFLFCIPQPKDYRQYVFTFLSPYQVKRDMYNTTQIIAYNSSGSDRVNKKVCNHPLNRVWIECSKNKDERCMEISRRQRG